MPLYRVMDKDSSLYKDKNIQKKNKSKFEFHRRHLFFKQFSKAVKHCEEESYCCKCSSCQLKWWVRSKHNFMELLM